MVPGGGTDSLAVEGVGGPKSDKGIDTAVYMYFVYLPLEDGLLWPLLAEVSVADTAEAAVEASLHSPLVQHQQSCEPCRLQQRYSVLRIRNKSFGSGFGSGSGLKLVSDPDPVTDPDSNPDLNPDPKCLFRYRIGSGSGQKFRILTDPDPQH